MEKKTTTRCERILAAFAHLKEKGLVKTQQDVADMMGANKTTVSQAFKGSEKYLSDISRQWLEGFDLFLSKRGNNANTRSIHIRNIRAVFNDAMDAGITVAYPFRRLVPKPTPASLRLVGDLYFVKSSDQ